MLLDERLFLRFNGYIWSDEVTCVPAKISITHKRFENGLQTICLPFQVNNFEFSTTKIINKNHDSGSRWNEHVNGMYNFFVELHITPISKSHI